MVNMLHTFGQFGKFTTSMVTAATLLFAISCATAQTPMQFSGVDCNGALVDLFADLDSGKAVILHFYMPNCGSCPPPAQKIQEMVKNVNARYPGMVKGYAFPYQNSTTCSYSSTWVSSNGLGTLFQPMDKGAAHVANYGGFGMPTVVLLGGSGINKRVLFSTLSFRNSDTTKMRDSILALLNTAGVIELPHEVAAFSVFPNPTNNVVSIQWDLNKSSDLTIDVTDVTGKHAALIYTGKSDGNNSIPFNTESLPSGIYLVRLLLNGKSATQILAIHH